MRNRLVEERSLRFLDAMSLDLNSLYISEKNTIILRQTVTRFTIFKESGKCEHFGILYSEARFIYKKTTDNHRIIIGCAAILTNLNSSVDTFSQIIMTAKGV